MNLKWNDTIIGLGMVCSACDSTTLKFAPDNDRELVFSDHTGEFVSGATHRKAEAVGMLVFLGSNPTREGDAFVIKTKRMKEITYNRSDTTGMCPGTWEAFRDEPTFGDCSLVLIDKQQVLTAAHCLDEAKHAPHQFSLANALVIFDHTNDTTWDHKDGGFVVPDADAYHVECIEACQEEVRGPDWVVLRLDRPPPGRETIPLATKDVVEGTELLALFHPLGLPIKAFGPISATTKCDQESWCAPFDNGDAGSGGALLDAKGAAVLGVIKGHVTAIPAAGCTMPNSDLQPFTPVQQIHPSAKPHESCDRFKASYCGNINTTAKGTKP
jgi:hypothetical protein